jgi:beta-lactamase regulating signal transducer with metallopeptidase domain
MELFLYWLLRASVVIALFYGFYKLFLAKVTFYALNRYALTLIALTTAVLPLFRFDLIPERKAEPLAVNLLTDFASLPAIEYMETQPRAEIPWMQILAVLFALGFLFTLVRYLIGLCQIAVLIRKSKKQPLEDHTVLCVTDKNISPFSWMKYIVLSRKELSADSQAIIRHEKAHIHLLHSFDMILFDVFTCLFWFNPFAWLLRREIQSVHEYQADRQVLNYGIDSTQYQLLLIRKSVGEQKFALANNFRQRDLHKRITMMKKNKTNRRMKWNYAMAAPALFLAMIALSVPKLNAKAVEKKNEKVAVVPVPVEAEEDGIFRFEADSFIVSSPNNNSEITIRMIPNARATSFHNSYEFDGVTLVIKAPLIIVDGKKMPKDFDINSMNDIAAVSMLDNEIAAAIYGEEEKNGVVLIETKKHKGKASVNPVLTDSLKGHREWINTVRPNNSSALIIVDGETVTEEEFHQMKPEEIEAISIWKDKAALESYGEKGKNGVIVITKKIQKP